MFTVLVLERDLSVSSDYQNFIKHVCLCGSQENSSKNIPLELKLKTFYFQLDSLVKYLILIIIIKFSASRSVLLLDDNILYSLEQYFDFSQLLLF